MYNIYQIVCNKFTNFKNVYIIEGMFRKYPGVQEVWGPTREWLLGRSAHADAT